MALGGHEGVIALFEVGRGRRHAEIVTPAIDFICAQADIGLDELGLVAVDVGPGPVHRDARRAVHRQGARPGPADPDDRHLLARPAGVPAPPLGPGRRAGHRRPQGRGVLRHVPPGAGRAAAGRRAAGRARSTSSSPTCSPAARRRCASATAPSATAPRSSTASTARSPTSRTRRPARSSSSPTPGPARGVGHARRDPPRLPPPARRPDQLGDPGEQGRGEREHRWRGSSSAPTPAASSSSRCAGATWPASSRSSGRRTPSRGRRPCSTTSSTRSAPATATTSWPGRGRAVVGYGGLMFVADEAHVTNIAVHPDHRRDGIATRLLGDLADVAIARGCAAWTLEVRASSPGAQALYRAFGFAPGRRPRPLLREHRGRHRHVVPRHPVARVRRAPGRPAEAS